MFERLRRWLSHSGKPVADIDEALWQRAEARLPFLDYLETAQRARLRELARGFLAGKQFHGAHGLEVNDEMMLTIALQACLPILRVGLEAYRGWVGIVVYPGEIVIPRQQMDEDGVVHEFEDEVLGEAWQDGPVLLSWETEAEEDGLVNVVIHEFAHKLDMLNGGADGFPPLPADMSADDWSGDFSRAYDSFCRALDMGLPTLLDPYAGEHPAEFFAVAAEVFFEAPNALKNSHPAVYKQLSKLFGSDPAAGEARLHAPDTPRN
ncbi:MAG: zinc-dependent peptidase [Pseudazoarcus pumilus]|nr:zinc-dependent peptidase [Pseudazoarcus pumilus]